MKLIISLIALIMAVIALTISVMDIFKSQIVEREKSKSSSCLPPSSEELIHSYWIIVSEIKNVALLSIPDKNYKCVKPSNGNLSIIAANIAKLKEQNKSLKKELSNFKEHQSCLPK